jgi:hypothetical protein
MSLVVLTMLAGLFLRSFLIFSQLLLALYFTYFAVRSWNSFPMVNSIDFMPVTKYTKVTVPGMVGNIGGTFGIFIGLAVFGLVSTKL